MGYDVFISYRFDEDRILAEAIQRDLHRLSKPSWFRMPALAVFRDETSAPTTANLWGLVRSALDDSRFLILIASPGSADSAWCEKEVKYWLSIRAESRILLVLTDGNIEWDLEAENLNWEKTDALSRIFSSVFANSPKYEDLRGLQSFSFQESRYRRTVINLSAAIRGVSPDTIESEELKQQRYIRNWIWTAIGALSILSVTAVGMALLANQRQDLALEQAEKARREAVRSERTADLLVSVFEPASPYLSGGKEVSAKEILDRSVPRISNRLSAEPILQASLFSTIGEIYTSLGEFDQAEELLGNGRRTLRSFPEEGDRLLAQNLYLSGALALERDQADVAAIFFQEALSRISMRPLDQDLLRPDILDGLGRAKHYIGKDSESAQKLEEAVRLLRAMKPAVPLKLASSISNLGLVRDSQGKYKEAGDLFQEARTIFESHLDGNFYPDYANVLNNMASFLDHVGDLAGAIEAYEKAVMMRRRLAPQHPDLAIQLTNLAHTYRKNGELEKAARAVIEALEIRKAVFGESSFVIAHSLKVLANIFHEQGNHEEDTRAYSQALAIIKKDERNVIPRAVVENDIANHYRDVGSFEKAQELYSQTLDWLRTVYEVEALPVIYVQLLMNQTLLLIVQGASNEAIQEAVTSTSSCAKFVLEPTDARWIHFRNKIEQILSAKAQEIDIDAIYAEADRECH